MYGDSSASSFSILRVAVFMPTDVGLKLTVKVVLCVDKIETVKIYDRDTR